MDKHFLIFPYTHKGKTYVEAYPFHCTDVLRYAPSNYTFTTQPSRNQARKEAYRRFIEPSGKGYNKYPTSPTVNQSFEEHWN